MIFDTNLLIKAIRNDSLLSVRVVIPIVVVGELEAFALKSDWGIQKVYRMNQLCMTRPIADLTRLVTPIYARVDAFSQGKLEDTPLLLSTRIWAKTTSG